MRPRNRVSRGYDVELKGVPTLQEDVRMAPASEMVLRGDVAAEQVLGFMF